MSRPCSFCDEPLSGPARTTLECGHSFHPGCFHRPALTGRNRCPKCDDSLSEAPRLDWLDDDLFLSRIPGRVKMNPSLEDVAVSESAGPSFISRAVRGLLESIGGSRNYRHADELVEDGLTFEQIMTGGWSIQDLVDLKATKAHLFAMKLSRDSWIKWKLNGVSMAENFDFGREEVERIFGEGKLPSFTSKEKVALGL